MARRTKKVGIVGKYGVRYGRAARKQLKVIETAQRQLYTCPFCAKDQVKRQACGIWNCRSCNKTIAGGAYSFTTSTGAAVRGAIRRITKE
ncbi:Ribosomal protein L37a [Spironucleus salmonicida]|uniref:Ribosomal protein L37a n=1 Tax=Spironucleus salmonicida TaxID=348837 RepID=V6M203_9EUKA|nr:Ribosomal protein L37a [Spironucleus salmonicida]|eukprot:EST47229.1 Ribosomal protein L37a [Spironucleus salmonicida]